MKVQDPEVAGKRIGRLVEEVRSAMLPPPSKRRAIRVKAGVPLRKAARALDVDVNTLMAWEKGAQPHHENAVRYRALLDALEKAVR
jgi:hypothetical protein